MLRFVTILVIALGAILPLSGASAVRAADVPVAPGTFAAALAAATPGSVLVLAPGRYDRFALRGLAGAPGQPVTLRAADPADPPRIAAMDLRNPRHIVL
ncbi:MAG: hypothetical protein ACK4OP_09170, partial [Gemmobacter sp.]